MQTNLQQPGRSCGMFRLGLLWLALTSTSPGRLWAEGSPLTPEQAIQKFRLPPGLQIELVAQEPDVQSPVAMAFDENGRLFVVEMLDYPNGPRPGQPPEGRITILEDRTGTGRYRKTAVFADRLLFANGLLPWRGGLIVTAAPHILFLKDINGDGKADTREVLYEGFAAENPQLRVSHPVLGLDNWIYVANGLRGGKVKRAGQGQAKPLELSGLDFRFDPIRQREEVVTGMGQFGNTFDDWGRRFVCTNRNHLIPIILAHRYMARNPNLAPPEPVRDNQNAGGAARTYPLSRNWTTSNLHQGSFSAACSVTIYRGGLLPGPYRGSAFTCDPTGNLVHQEILSPSGAGFSWRPPREGVEFLASPDDWFRPVNLAHGPDGGLYVVDMYRAVIEHPEFMPTELKNRPDLLLGKERGRIWRIVPADRQAHRSKPNLGQAANEELAEQLRHSDAWWRTTAQRLLLERGGASCLPHLERLLLKEPAVARAHAAWLLNSFGSLTPGQLKRLLADPEPRVREQALILSENLLPTDTEVQQLVCGLADDPDGRVRFQAALSLGFWDSPSILSPLARIAAAGAKDPWTRTAVASAVPRRAGALLCLLLGDRHDFTSKAGPDRLQLIRELAAIVGARQDQVEIGSVLSHLSVLSKPGTGPWLISAFTGMAEGMGRRGVQFGVFLRTLVGTERPAAERALQFLNSSAQTAANHRRPQVERVAATRLLAHADWSRSWKVLEELLSASQAQEMRLAAVQALAAHSHADVASILLRNWRSYSPALRREATEALLRSLDRLKLLFAELEAGRLRPADLDPHHVRLLLNHAQPAIRDSARRLLQSQTAPDRKAVVKSYQASLGRKGDPERGREIFKKNCSTCHSIAGMGTEVGPDISDTRVKTPEALLSDILDPNAALDGNYVNYVVTTKSGRVLTGMIAAESAAGLTLRRAENQTDVLLRQDIEEVQSTGVSLMPENLEKSVSVAEMADLIAFLKNWRYLDGRTPRVEP